MSSKLKYRPDIDGLRAVAVIPVMLFHAGVSLFAGGFVGVDIFFVISGYLITTIILNEVADGRFSIINFYERRARRILPALFVVLAVSTIIAWFTLYSGEMKSFMQSMVAVTVFSSNILFWMESGYWDTESELKPLLHTWTLAVEEQFYIFFPLLLLLLWKIKKNSILLVLSLIFIVSLAISHWGAYQYPNATFYLLHTRAWELMVGSLIAYVSVHRQYYLQFITKKHSTNQIMSLTGLAMIMVAIFWLDETTPFPSLYALLPTVGTGLIIIHSKPNTVVSALLSTKIMVIIGLISYSAYLWHQPLFAFARYAFYPEPSVAMFLGLSVLSLVLAYLSWKYIEAPFRNKQRMSRSTIFWFSGIGSAAFFALGLAGHLSNGFEQRAIHDNVTIKQFQYDNSRLLAESWGILKARTGDSGYRVDSNAVDMTAWFPQASSKQNLLVVGNSHSKDIFNLFMNSQSATEHFNLARFGVQVHQLSEEDHPFYRSPNLTDADVVVIASRYSRDDADSLETVAKLLLKRNKRVAIVRNIHEFETPGGRTIADHLIQRQYAKSYREGMSAQAIVEKIDEHHYVSFAQNERKKDHLYSDQAIDQLLAKHPDVIALDRSAYTCDPSSKRWFSMNNDFEKYYYDYGHHTLEGAEFLATRIDEIDWLAGLISAPQDPAK